MVNKESDDFMKLLVYSKNNQIGVTSIINRIVDNEFKETNNDSNNKFVKTKVIKNDNLTIKLLIYDSSYREFNINCLRGAHGFIICYDITNKKSFEDIKDTLNDLEKYGPENYKDCTIFIGNKLDLDQYERQVKYNDAKEYFESIGFIDSFFEVSCKSSINIEESFNTIFNKTLNKLYPINN